MCRPDLRWIYLALRIRVGNGQNFVLDPPCRPRDKVPESTTSFGAFNLYRASNKKLPMQRKVKHFQVLNRNDQITQRYAESAISGMSTEATSKPTSYAKPSLKPFSTGLQGINIHPDTPETLKAFVGRLYIHLRLLTTLL